MKIVAIRHKCTMHKHKMLIDNRMKTISLSPSQFHVLCAIWNVELNHDRSNIWTKPQPKHNQFAR